MKEKRFRKFGVCLSCMVLIAALAACASTSFQTEEKESADLQQNRAEASGEDKQPVRAEGSETNILIAYFTWAENTHVKNPKTVDVDATTSASVLPPGNTAKMAGWIQERAGGDLFSIVVTEPYSEDYDECLDRAADEKAVGARPELVNHVENMEDYDVIFLGFPNWWYTAPMAVFSFIEEYELSGKTIIPFCAHGTGGLSGSVKDIAEALPDSAEVLEPIGVYRPDVDSAQPVINEWLDSLGYTEESKTQVQETSAESGSLPIVYMTTEISAESLMEVYEALGASPAGRIAVKLSTGEPGSNYLRTDLIGDFVMSLEGPTIVECNTAYGGSRANTAMHYQVAEEHGYTAIADVDIMDENGSMTLTVEGGDNLTENYVGANFANYDYYVILSHFKGHTMAGFGGAIKNISIGIASSEGKAHIHSGGTGGNMWGGDQDAFLESMAEAGKSVVDYLDGNILYINVMNRLSVDCDCDGNPAEPDMHDIGILASFDPVALDQACVDLVYEAEDGQSLISRIESRNGLHTLDQAEKIGLGSRKYQLVNIDE